MDTQNREPYRKGTDGPGDALREQVLRAVAAYDMFRAGDAAVLGVSGGADSMTLLHLFHSLRAHFRLSALLVCHLHHGIRGPEADRDAAFVRSACGSLDLPCEVSRADVPGYAAEHGLSEEAAGRELRYAFFEDAADRLARQLGLAPGQVKIATAHTKNDNAETLLLNLIRGSALRGLTGIPPVRGRIIRPLLDCSRAQIERYCADNQIAYIQDSTNEGDDYRRNRLRHTAIPLFTDLNPNFLDAAARTAETLRSDETYLRDLADKALAGAQFDENVYDRRALASLPASLCSRCCAAILRSAGADVDFAKVGLLAGYLQEGSGAVAVGKDVSIAVTARQVSIKHATKAAPMDPVPFYPGAEVSLGDTVLSCELRNGVFLASCMEENGLNCEIFKKNVGNDLKNALDYDRIIGSLSVRARRPGDSIRLAGRGCTKTLKKLFNETRCADRDTRPLLADEQGIVWIQGLGVAERVRLTADSQRLLLISLRPVS